MLILLSGGRNRRDYELEMAQLRSGERSHITSGTLLKNIQRTKAAFQEVFDSDGYVTPTEIHCPLCGQVRKSPDNGSGSLIIRHLKLEHVLRNRRDYELGYFMTKKPSKITQNRVYLRGSTN